MADPMKIAGQHLSIYESYYSIVDPNNIGRVEAMDAAKFLKKSHLSDIILSKIWDMADPNSNGFLDKPGMFVALKLCAMAQQGHSLDKNNICMDIAPPKMGDALTNIKKPQNTQSAGPPKPQSNWSISPLERQKYEKLFYSLEPISGYIPGNKVKGVLMDSKLPLETLGKIWDLADMDKDGKLNMPEFTIAMHLVYKALEKNTIPNVLPSELLKEVSLKEVNLIKPDIGVSVPPPAIPKPVTTKITSEIKTSDWVVSNEDLIYANKLFVEADKDHDGFVSGLEIKDIFLQSGLSQAVLAHIWSLCDTFQSGKLNNEQFALSMWLMKHKRSGNELPPKLLPEMIPPSLRKKNSEANIENNNPVPTYSNPELDMISKNIMEIIRDKHAIEQDISQKEADIKIKNGEIKSLQSELDTLAATLRQLDNQKGEAQKRLNDLKAQIDKLRQQATDQESTLKVQEDELNSKRKEIESLKSAEQELETKQNECKNHLNSLSNQLQNIQLQISQTKANMTQLEEQQRQILDAITQFDSAFAMGDATMVPDTTLYLKPKLDEIMYGYDNSQENKTKDSTKDAFNNNEDFKQTNIQAAFDNTSNFPSHDNDAFQRAVSETKPIEDPFGEDPFAALHAPTTRSESPSPALPPKKSKQPPPRPAPPRAALGPQAPSQASAFQPVTASADPFGDKAFSGSSDFADFANFDQKI